MERFRHQDINHSRTLHEAHQSRVLASLPRFEHDYIPPPQTLEVFLGKLALKIEKGVLSEAEYEPRVRNYLHNHYDFRRLNGTETT